MAGIELEGCSVAGLETCIMLPRWWVRHCGWSRNCWCMAV